MPTTGTLAPVRDYSAGTQYKTRSIVQDKLQIAEQNTGQDNQLSTRDTAEDNVKIKYKVHNKGQRTQFSKVRNIRQECQGKQYIARISM
jgi:hypothetical protein